MHPNCTFQGSLGSSRLGPPNSSQTVSVSSPQSRSSSSASPAPSLSLSLSICLPNPGHSISLFPIRIRAPLLVHSIPPKLRVDSLAVALIRSPHPLDPSLPSSRHPIPPSPLFLEPGFGEKQARRTRRYPFLEALYSCHLDTFCTKPHVPKQHRPSRGKKRDRQKQKFPAPHPLNNCLDFFPIRDRFVTHHAELSSTPQKIFAQPRHQPTQHTTRHDTKTQLATCLLFLTAKPRGCLGL